MQTVHEHQSDSSGSQPHPYTHAIYEGKTKTRKKRHMVEQFQHTGHLLQQQYTLSLATLLGALQAHGQSCMLWSHLPDDSLPSLEPFLSSMQFVSLKSQYPKVQTHYQGELLVIEGHLTSSRIRELTQDRVVVEGHTALTVLSHSPILTWMIRPHTAHLQNWHGEPKTTEPLAPSVSTRWLRPTPPQLIRPLHKEEMEALSYQQRLVLHLIQATRDLSTICRVLHTTPQRLTPLLDALADQGWIT
jgi:hypothetical protein